MKNKKTKNAHQNNTYKIYNKQTNINENLPNQ